MKQEEQITEAICKYLSLFPNGELRRIAPSGYFDGKVMRKHKSKFIKRGVADIQFAMAPKIFMALEVKTPLELKYVMLRYQKILRSNPDTLNEKDFHIWEQIQYLEGIKRAGFIGQFVCSVKMVQKILQKL